ncbi:MAG: lytic transglycosylase domain-containing protein, partial [Pseudomonadales bacterium]|nr:lytic transglycosylase domain-containing protein [Pseudomonadales bacterium]
VHFLERDDKQLANNLKMVHLSPWNVQKIATFREDHEKNRFIIAHGVERLARINANAAHDAFEEHQALHNFSDEVKNRVWVTVGIHLTFDGDPLNHLDDLPINITEHPDLTEARIRFALRRQNWGDVLVYINLLPEEFQASPRWQYWKARVLMGSDDQADRQAAQEMFRKIAAERNYYGFLAADSIRQPYNFDDNPTPISQEQILSLEATPGIQRALELFVLNEMSRARREWYFTTSEFSDIERQVAARVARKWGWYRHAIHSMIRAEAWDDLEIRFPLAYQHTFTANARTADIPLHWSMAVARQESAFMPDARSSAGALGIMQLMPATAALVADSMDMKGVSESDLTDPSLNIQLGSWYLGSLLRQFDQNRILATAAYNAGPGRVREWLDPSLPLDVWIETIPYRETRHYVQNVLM